MACFEYDDIFEILESQKVFKSALPELSSTAENVRAADELKELLKKRSASQAGHEDTTVKKKTKINYWTVDSSILSEQLPQIKVQQIKSRNDCKHEVAIPHNEKYAQLVSGQGEPAKIYPFPLDTFQKQAILCIENKRSVLVSAHTSAGKTVVAEYAIATCLKNGQRVIYTTPIKALSNQKYRDFSEEFHDVGLITGDVSINPNASCLIMTTEILRSMLYRGSEETNEAGWIIFDEIHYMRNKSRGYIWEETIILLNPSIPFLFLSATLPNATQFAQWIVRLHQQPCHVVYTDQRPTPLQHYVFPAGGSQIFMVLDEKNNFKEQNFEDAIATMHTASVTAGASGVRGAGSITKAHDVTVTSMSTKKKKPTGNPDCLRLLKMVMDRNFAPAVVFCFSKKDCEALALQVSELEFNTAAEKKLVQEIFSNATAVLSEQSRTLPQLTALLPLLKRGIAVHHAGLLPILRETVEILFSEGLIKALFATETFSMGLNMPTRTVLFTNLRKYDGVHYRWLTGGEYTQMAGRAGRRGKDERGIVILMIDDNSDSKVVREMVQGKSDPMDSSFHLTYNMILNLHKIEQISPDYLLQRSFFYFQHYPKVPGIFKRLEAAERELRAVHVGQESVVEGYCGLRDSIATLEERRRATITAPQHALQFLKPGRLVKVRNGACCLGWGALLRYSKSRNPHNPRAAAVIRLSVVISVAQDTSHNQKLSWQRVPPPGEAGVTVEALVPLSDLMEISAVRIKLPTDITSPSARKIIARLVQESMKRVPAEQFLLDPVSNMKIKNRSFLQQLADLTKLRQRLQQHSFHQHTHRDSILAKYDRKQKAESALRSAQKELRAAEQLMQFQDLSKRRRVLRRLGFVTAHDLLQEKGRVASEISAGDELLCTELLYSGMFNSITVAQTCAVLSAVVCEERSRKEPELKEELQPLLKQLKEHALNIAKVLRECKIDVDEDEYVGSFKPHVMNLVHDWATGAEFMHISKATNIFAGNLVRTLRRLEELLRQMVMAAKVVGLDLQHKFTECITAIKRDVVFAASLYL
uniref:Superkiller viralicidic activity 2-like 2 n=1 Tax=Hirondellea gigas TaxID=1518452 RepID=A0A2P2I3W5_9CRUS